MKKIIPHFLLFLIAIIFPKLVSAQRWYKDSTHLGIKSVVMNRYTFGANGDSAIAKFSESNYDKQGRLTISIAPRSSQPNLFDTIYYSYSEKNGERTIKSAQGNSYSLLTYDKNGVFIHEQDFFNNVLEEEKIYSYKNGHRVKEQYFTKGKLIREENYSFDNNADGKLESTYSVDVNGKKKLIEKRWYNKEGKLSVVVNYMDGEIYGDSIVYSYTSKTKIAQYYDRHRILSSYLSYDSHDSLLSNIFYHAAEEAIGPKGSFIRPAYLQDSLVITRDSSGNRLKSVSLHRRGGSSLETFTYEYYSNNLIAARYQIMHNDTMKNEQWTYNENGKLTKYQKTSFKKALNTEIELYLYNSKGDLVEERSYLNGHLNFKNVYEIQYY